MLDVTVKVSFIGMSLIDTRPKPTLARLKRHCFFGVPTDAHSKAEEAD